MKIEVWVSTDKVGSKCVDEFEIDDDATEEDIEEMASDTMFRMIEWNWRKKP